MRAWYNAEVGATDWSVMQKLSKSSTTFRRHVGPPSITFHCQLQHQPHHRSHRSCSIRLHPPTHCRGGAHCRGWLIAGGGGIAHRCLSVLAKFLSRPHWVRKENTISIVRHSEPRPAMCVLDLFVPKSMCMTPEQQCRCYQFPVKPGTHCDKVGFDTVYRLCRKSTTSTVSLWPVHTGGKVERTFDIRVTKSTDLVTVSTATSCRIRLRCQCNRYTAIIVETDANITSSTAIVSKWRH